MPVPVAISAGVKARVVNWKQVAVSAVLECTNCSLQVTVGGALSETVVTVSLYIHTYIHKSICIARITVK